VDGDSRLERVVQISTFVAVTGPGHQAAKGTPTFNYRLLPRPTYKRPARGLERGRKSELLVEVAQRVGSAHASYGRRSRYRRHAQADIWRAIALRTAEGFVQATLTVKPASAGSRLNRVPKRRAYGLNENTYRAPALAGRADFNAMDAVQKRVYRWDGQRFAVFSEQPSSNAVTASGPVARASVGPAGEARRTQEQRQIAESKSEALIELFGGRSVSPRVSSLVYAKANLAEDKETETLVVWERPYSS